MVHVFSSLIKVCVAVAVVLGFTFTPAAALSNNGGTSEIRESFKQEIQELHTELNVWLAKKRSLVEGEEVSNELTQTAKSNFFGFVEVSWEPFDDETYFLTKNKGMSLTEYDKGAGVSVAKKDYDLRVEEANNLYSVWRKEVDAEKTRLEEARKVEAERILEETRKAEAAKKVAEGTRKATPNKISTTPPPANNSKTPTVPVSPPVTGGETGEQRIARIAATLPFPKPSIIIKEYNCGGRANVLGCYTNANYGVWELIITPYGLTKKDCKLRETIAHEVRHSQQAAQSLITWDDNGNVSNSSWLESDANAFAKPYGC